MITPNNSVNLKTLNTGFSSSIVTLPELCHISQALRTPLEIINTVIWVICLIWIPLSPFCRPSSWVTSVSKPVLELPLIQAHAYAVKDLIQALAISYHHCYLDWVFPSTYIFSHSKSKSGHFSIFLHYPCPRFPNISPIFITKTGSI